MYSDLWSAFNSFSFSAACESGSNSPILNFSEFVKKVTWSGRYIWNYVVKGETGCDNSESSLSRDLGDAEEEMEKFQSSADMGQIFVSFLLQFLWFLTSRHYAHNDLHSDSIKNYCG